MAEKIRKLLASEESTITQTFLLLIFLNNVEGCDKRLLSKKNQTN